MLRLTCCVWCAGCVEVLAEPRALMAAFWTVHRPPSEAAAALALRLLHSLAPTPAAAWAAAAQGGALYLLSTLLPTQPPDEARQVAAVPPSLLMFNEDAPLIICVALRRLKWCCGYWSGGPMGPYTALGSCQVAALSPMPAHVWRGRSSFCVLCCVA